jgi:nitrogen regulatory protein PII
MDRRRPFTHRKPEEYNVVDTVKIKLVTMVVSSEMLDRLTVALKALGAAGYTSVGVNGHGLHGARTRNAFDSGNVRLEMLVSPAVADKILEHVATQYAGFDIVAFTHDVEAVPRAHFG